jgi:hypothetical protein
LPCSALNLLLFQRTDVTYELLDLVVGELALPWHLAFAVFGDLRQLGVGLFLHVVRAEITKLHGFPHGSVALAVRAVAGRALCLKRLAPSPCAQAGPLKRSRTPTIHNAL